MPTIWFASMFAFGNFCSFIWLLTSYCTSQRLILRYPKWTINVIFNYDGPWWYANWKVGYFVDFPFTFYRGKRSYNLVTDVFSPQKTGCLYEHIRWGDAFLVVYSICDKSSFADAEDYLQQLSKLKLPSYYTALLLGNKRDLDHSR